MQQGVNYIDTRRAKMIEIAPIKIATAPTDYRTVFLNHLGDILRRYAPYKNIVGITRDKVDKDIAAVTMHDIVRDVDYTVRVDIGNDNEWQAMKDIIEALD